MFGVGLCYISYTEVMAHLWLWEVIYTVGVMAVDGSSVNREFHVTGLERVTTLDLEAYV